MSQYRGYYYNEAHSSTKRRTNLMDLQNILGVYDRNNKQLVQQVQMLVKQNQRLKQNHSIANITTEHPYNYHHRVQKHRGHNRRNNQIYIYGKSKEGKRLDRSGRSQYRQRSRKQGCYEKYKRSHYGLHVGTHINTTSSQSTPAEENLNFMGKGSCEEGKQKVGFVHYQYPSRTAYIQQPTIVDSLNQPDPELYLHSQSKPILHPSQPPHSLQHSHSPQHSHPPPRSPPRSPPKSTLSLHVQPQTILQAHLPYPQQHPEPYSNSVKIALPISQLPGSQVKMKKKYLSIISQMNKTVHK